MDKITAKSLIGQHSEAELSLSFLSAYISNTFSIPIIDKSYKLKGPYPSVISYSANADDYFSIGCERRNIKQFIDFIVNPASSSSDKPRTRFLNYRIRHVYLLSIYGHPLNNFNILTKGSNSLRELPQSMLSITFCVALINNYKSGIQSPDRKKRPTDNPWDVLNNSIKEYLDPFYGLKPSNSDGPIDDTWGYADIFNDIFEYMANSFFFPPMLYKVFEEYDFQVSRFLAPDFRQYNLFQTVSQFGNMVFLSNVIQQACLESILSIISQLSEGNNESGNNTVSFLNKQILNTYAQYCSLEKELYESFLKGGINNYTPDNSIDSAIKKYLELKQEL